MRTQHSPFKYQKTYHLESQQEQTLQDLTTNHNSKILFIEPIRSEVPYQKDPILHFETNNQGQNVQNHLEKIEGSQDKIRKFRKTQNAQNIWVRKPKRSEEQIYEVQIHQEDENSMRKRAPEDVSPYDLKTGPAFFARTKYFCFD